MYVDFCMRIFRTRGGPIPESKGQEETLVWMSGGQISSLCGFAPLINIVVWPNLGSVPLTCYPETSPWIPLFIAHIW